jgi:hypothetical protein
MSHLEELYQQHLENCPEIISWAFENKPKNFYDIIKIFDIEGSSSTINRFLVILRLAEKLKNANCSNIQEKFAEVSEWNKFLSLGSELFFAYEFVKLGFDVSLIPDNSSEWKNSNGKDCSSPDIRIQKNGKEFLIEVARISDDETTSDIAQKINPIIRKNIFRVRIQYCEDFCVPVVFYTERNEREELIEKFVDQFRETIKTVDHNSLPQTKDIHGCQVEFSEAYKQEGYYAGCRTSAIIIPDEKFQDSVKNTLEKKAKKRQQWNDSQQKLPYLIALDIQQNLYFDDKLVSLLFGGTWHSLCSQFEHPNEPEIVTYAKENGWKVFLENVGFNSQPNSYIREPGMLIEDNIFENVTGIIANIKNILQVVPNPFAEKQINCLELEEIIPWRSVSDIY